MEVRKLTKNVFILHFILPSYAALIHIGIRLDPAGEKDGRIST